MRTVRAGRICPAPFSLILIDVDPAVLKPLFYLCHIILSERRQRRENGILRLPERDLPRGVSDHRRINIVHVQFIHAKTFFAQSHIAVHFIEIGADRLKQTLVDF